MLKDHKMMLINTGITRKSTNVLKTIDLDKSYKLLSTVDDLERSIIEKNTKDFFKIFNEGWKIKKTTSLEIMNNEELLGLEKYLIKSEKIKGLKLCGAGGGGYFLIFVEKKDEDSFVDFFRKKYSTNPIVDLNIESHGVVGTII